VPLALEWSKNGFRVYGFFFGFFCSILGLGVGLLWVFPFLFWAMIVGLFFGVMTHFCFGLGFARWLWRSKSSSIIFTCMGEPLGEKKIKAQLFVLV
jgi:hypothetical protein